MTTDPWEPDWRVHPGESIREAREAAGLSQKALAEAWHVAQPYVCNLERGRKNVTARVALRLEAMGWGPALFWMNLQTHFDLHKAREEAPR